MLSPRSVQLAKLTVLIGLAAIRTSTHGFLVFDPEQLQCHASSLQLGVHPTEIDDSALADRWAQRLPKQPRLELRLAERARRSPVETRRAGPFEVVAHGASTDRARPGYLS